FRGERGCVAQLKEATDRFAHRPVLGKVPAGLPHDPDGRAFLAVAEHSPQQRTLRLPRAHSRVRQRDSRLSIFSIMTVFCPNSTPPTISRPAAPAHPLQP